MYKAAIPVYKTNYVKYKCKHKKIDFEKLKSITRYIENANFDYNSYK